MIRAEAGVTSSYIVDRNPRKFGGRQEDWEKQSRSAISDAAAEMKAAREGEFDGKALFHRLLENFEKIRGGGLRSSTKQKTQSALVVDGIT